MKTPISPNVASRWPEAGPDKERLTLKVDQLAQQWHSLFGADSPGRLLHPLMIQTLAYRIQEKVASGFD